MHSEVVSAAGMPSSRTEEEEGEAPIVEKRLVHYK